MAQAKRRRSRSARRRAPTRARAKEMHADTTSEARGAVAAPAPPREQRPSASAATRLSVPRPRAPWHPLPLSELVIVAGGISVLFSVANGIAGSEAALFVGLGAVLLGTLEVTLREHLGGYRSHALLLAVLVVVVMHTAIVLLVSSFAEFPRAANLVLVAVDLAIGFVVYRFLRLRYVEARRRLVLVRD